MTSSPPTSAILFFGSFAPPFRLLPWQRNEPSRAPAHELSFREVVEMIEGARARAYHAVNHELIDLYWRIGEFISRQITAAGWGKNTVSDLSAFIRARRLGIRGFSASNLWRMRQFHDTYVPQPKLAALLRELNWTHKDHEVVESPWPAPSPPALIAEYQTALPDKQLLQRKLHEFYQLALPTPARANAANQPSANMPKSTPPIPNRSEEIQPRPDLLRLTGGQAILLQVGTVQGTAIRRRTAR